MHAIISGRRVGVRARWSSRWLASSLGSPVCGGGGGGERGGGGIRTIFRAANSQVSSHPAQCPTDVASSTQTPRAALTASMVLQSLFEVLGPGPRGGHVQVRVQLLPGGACVAQVLDPLLLEGLSHLQVEPLDAARVPLCVEGMVGMVALA